MKYCDLMVFNFLTFWITSLFKYQKKEFSALDGRLSIFFASFLIGLLNYIIDFIKNPNFNLLAFISSFFLYPLIALGIAFLLVLTLRISSSIFNGKGNLASEWNAISPTYGSVVFMFGIFFVIWMNLLEFILSTLFGQLPAETTNYYFLMSKLGVVFIIGGAMIGILCLFGSYLFGAMQGYWFEKLKSVEGLEPHLLSKLIWLALGITAFVLAVTISVIMSNAISSAFLTMGNLS